MSSRYRKRPVVITAYQTRVEEQIQTLEGTMTAHPGDWIITGVAGERYPCKPEIFEKTYEPVAEGEPDSPSTLPHVVCAICGRKVHLGAAVGAALNAYAEVQNQQGCNRLGDRERLLLTVGLYLATVGFGRCARCNDWPPNTLPFREDVIAFDETVRAWAGEDMPAPDPLGPLRISRRMAHG